MLTTNLKAIICCYLSSNSIAIHLDSKPWFQKPSRDPKEGSQDH